MSIDTTKYANYYATPSEFSYLLDWSQSWTILDNLIKGTLTGYDVSGFFQSNSDYVTNLRYYPFEVSKICNDVLQSTTGLHLGKASFTQFTPYIIRNQSSAPVKKWFEFSLSRYFNNFLDFAPYTKVKLMVPFFDSFDLPLEICYTQTKIEGYLTLDVKTGLMRFSLFTGGGLFLFDKTIKIGIDIPLGKSNAEEIQRNNVLQAISFGGSLFGLGLGVASGNPLITAGSAGLLTKNIAQAMNNNVDRLSSYQSNSGDNTSLSCDKDIRLLIERPKDVRFPDIAIKGRVCRRKTTLDNLKNNYTEIGDIIFNPSNEVIYDDEISEIVDLLKSGVIL